jgi:DNA-binding HxlR family transcriptional regulator
MKPYRQYCPVAKAHEILGDRWTILIVRELIDGMEHFNDIARGLPGIPRSTLSSRLLSLEKNGIVKRSPQKARGYRYNLTAAGRDMRPVVAAMGRWGAAWAFEFPNEEELDPGLLLWKMQNHLNVEALPRDRVTIAFDFQKGRKREFWFVINKDEASVCLTDPGFEIGLVVTADLSAFYQVWLGKMTLRRAMSENLICIEGIPAYEKAFPRWFHWSSVAKVASRASTSN